MASEQLLRSIHHLHHRVVQIAAADLFDDPLRASAAAQLYIRRYLRKRRYLIAILTGPAAIIKDWSLPQQIAYEQTSFQVEFRSDAWCIAQLRFTRHQIDMAAIEYWKFHPTLNNAIAHLQLQH
jgi:hypothetical protein